MSRLPLEQMIASLRPDSSSSPKFGTIGAFFLTAMVIASPSWLLHAAVGLGQPRDVGHLLGRLLGEELELALGGDSADRLDPPRCRSLALLLEVLAEEPDQAPVLVGHLDADRVCELGAERLVPFVVHGQEALVVDVDLPVQERGDWHSLALLG